jgi:hypothetical protein
MPLDRGQKGLVLFQISGGIALHDHGSRANLRRKINGADFTYGDLVEDFSLQGQGDFLLERRSSPAFLLSDLWIQS